jgi:Fe-S-cluster-containing dehydrogenase component
MGYSRFMRLPQDLRNIRCEDCQNCAVRCPYGVRVRERVTRAQYLFS